MFILIGGVKLVVLLDRMINKNVKPNKILYVLSILQNYHLECLVGSIMNTMNVYVKYITAVFPHIITKFKPGPLIK